MEYPYFKGLEADRYSFYRVPKALVKADLFQKMSGDAKLLYAVLLDRMSLSIKNGWQDKHGNAYIICTIRNFPNCKQNCPTSGSIILTVYPAISLPLGGNTRTMQPLSADGWLTIPLKLPRKGAYPITATRREKVYETSF